MQKQVKILVPLPLSEPFNYAVPDGMDIAVGDVVLVPFGNMKKRGVVWSLECGLQDLGAPTPLLASPRKQGEGQKSEENLQSDRTSKDLFARTSPVEGRSLRGGGAQKQKTYKLKFVEKKLDAPSLPATTLKFIDWVADYTLAPRGAVFAMVVSVKEALDPPKQVVGFRALDEVVGHPPPSLPPQAGGGTMRDSPQAGGGKEEYFPQDRGNKKPKVTKARQKVLDVLVDGGVFTSADLSKEAGVSASVVKTMAAAGMIEEVELPEDFMLPEVIAEPDKPELSEAQKKAAGVLEQKIVENKYSTTVLDGVTGSGKTEVYFEAIDRILEEGKQALVLLPEIVLTTQFLKRFKKRFGVAPTQWHSGLTPARRRKNWRAIARGHANLIIGARSALFLPYPNLGIIIVDEEHESAYKQEEGVIYHGRDMAVVRANIEDIPVVLASATPSLETMVNVEAGKYEHLHLPERHGFATIPMVDTVDMRNEKLDAGNWLSFEMKESMVQTLERGDQVLLFLNRRGYAPLTLCRHCGFRYKCTECTSWLVKHKYSNLLQCHHCGHTEKIQNNCPECGTEKSLAECGPGVERLEEEVRDMLPNARIVLMTSDTTSNPKAAQEIINAILEKRVDVIIGTQLVTKGHHFPDLTLVGIVDADLGLEGGDLRAAEKTFQILHQVSGRAGREEKQGRAIIQSYMPDHGVMHALVTDNRDAFIKNEIMSRHMMQMPPFGKLAALIISGKDERQVRDAAVNLVKCSPRGPGLEILGPAPAPLSLLRGSFRYRILVKAQRKINIQKMLRLWMDGFKVPSNIRVKIDVDPYSFM